MTVMYIKHINHSCRFFVVKINIHIHIYKLFLEISEVT